MREYNFDGLVGPTHNYGGLSPGNLASTSHLEEISNPLGAVLQSLNKMRFIFQLGVGQAMMPPHPRPSLRALRALGFLGSDEEVLSGAASHPHLLRLCSSSAGMWTANAATCAPSSDTADGRVHLTVANLHQMFHRAIESETTFALFKKIFHHPNYFSVHPALPGGGQFADEGAANHFRLKTAQHRALHLFAWGKSSYRRTEAPQIHVARQTKEASQAVARLNHLESRQCLFPQQSPSGIDAGAFHSDVLAVGNENFLMLHKHAFVDSPEVLRRIQNQLGDKFCYVLAEECDLPLNESIAAYPFNSQIVTLLNGTMAIVAPKNCLNVPSARAFLERVVAEDNPVHSLHYLELGQSMNNGGGPACLRLRIGLTDEEKASIEPNIFYSPTLHRQLEVWARRYYRDRLSSNDLKDSQLARESMEALDQLTQILRLGSVYDFQTFKEL